MVKKETEERPAPLGAAKSAADDMVPPTTSAPPSEGVVPFTGNKAAEDILGTLKKAEGTWHNVPADVMQNALGPAFVPGSSILKSAFENCLRMSATSGKVEVRLYSYVGTGEGTWQARWSK